MAVGVRVNAVLVEDGSSDGSDKRACDLLSGIAGTLIKCGRNDSFSGLSRTEKLQQLRNLGLEQSLCFESHWTMFLDSNIYFRLSVPLEMIEEAKVQGIRGLLTPFTMGNYVRFRAGRNLFVKGRNFREQHYFDTYALQLIDGRTTFPACPFAGCSKCRHGLIDRHEVKAMATHAAFGGLALIETEVLRRLEVSWPRGKIGQECEHIEFCRALREADHRQGVYILTQIEAYCDRSS